MSLSNTLLEYRNNVSECQGFINFALSRYASGGYKFSRDKRIFITESAFLKFFISWETFLEKAFHFYLLGLPSISGSLPVRFVTPIDERHAQGILIGTQKYVDWANPEIIRKLSILYFEHGDIINSQLSSINSELLDLRTIRNSAAHMSSTTSSKLDGLATRLLGRSCHNISVFELLLSINPISPTADHILEGYIDMLDVSAELIATG